MFFEILAGLIIGAACCIVITGIICYQTIKEEIKKNFPSSFKVLIKEKEKNAIKVGIYDNNNNEIANDVEIRSEEGVSSSIYRGQRIYC